MTWRAPSALRVVQRVSQSGSAGLTLPKMDATAGLVFGLLLHCIADGVALGSSSLSHSEALRYGCRLPAETIMCLVSFHL